ncbi:MAG TPA: hypothetical protein VN911_00905 [Candidatus Acidoferrum sp.]|nr:hypothetical protein [Candidatus Acidoferrum sp.]
MTLAICIFCGVEKFGAFTPCDTCGTVPTTIIDRAKSLMLSDHNFPPEDLREFGRAIESGMGVPYDFVTLAISAEPIAEEYYYWNNITDAGRLKCMHCGKEFMPEDEQVFCGGCRPEIEREFRVCFNCPMIYEEGTQFCQKCGAAFGPRDVVKAKDIAQDIAFSVRQFYRMQSAINKSNFLGPIHRELSPEKRAAAGAELEKVAFYSAVLTLRKLSPSNTAVFAIIGKALEVYRQSFLLQGTPPIVAGKLVERYLKRFTEYDDTFARAKSELPDSSERWILFVAGDAVKNCYGVETTHLGIITDMVLFIGYFVKMLTETTASLLQKHRATAKSAGDFPSF